MLGFFKYFGISYSTLVLTLAQPRVCNHAVGQCRSSQASGWSLPSSPMRATTPWGKKMHTGSKNGSAEVYPRASTADQKSGGAWQEPRRNCRVDRRDRWFAASHVLQVGRQSAATYF